MNKKILSFALSCGLLASGACVMTACDSSIPHTHDYIATSTYCIEDGKAYEIEKCSCEETKKVELTNYQIATTETAQNLIDNADAGVTIVLSSGDYGTLYLRKNDRSERVASTWAGGNEDAVWKRTINGLTIVGTEGTILKSFDAEAYTYAKTQHSLSETYPYLICYMDITNLSIKNITFNPDENDVAIDVACSGQQVSINGLIIDNCVVNGKNSTKDNGNRLFASSVTDATAFNDKNGNTIITQYRKNITISNCTLNNLYQGMRIYYAENLTISNNKFNNVKGQNILLNSGKFEGNITIEGNTSTGSTERFIRMTNLKGNLCVKGNKVENYSGEDTDIVKITNNLESATIGFENNDWNGSTDEQAIENKIVVYPN